MKNKPLVIILAIIVCGTVTLTFVDIFTNKHISQPKELQENIIKNILPNNAVIIEDLGNNWVYFKLNKKLFLYHRGGSGYSSIECITQVQ